MGHVGRNQNLKDLKDERTQGFAADPVYVKGKVFAYVGLPPNIKDLRQYLQAEMLAVADEHDRQVGRREEESHPCIEIVRTSGVTRTMNQVVPGPRESPKLIVIVGF